MLSTALFRIFQEALTNIARHANAASVRTIIHQEEDRIRLNVADDAHRHHGRQARTAALFRTHGHAGAGP